MVKRKYENILPNKKNCLLSTLKSETLVYMNHGVYIDLVVNRRITEIIKRI